MNARDRKRQEAWIKAEASRQVAQEQADALTAVGVPCAVRSGWVALLDPEGLMARKVWWCWYVNLACQALWLAYALATQQYGFIAAACVYSVVFTQNARAWTKEHREKREQER